MPVLWPRDEISAAAKDTGMLKDPKQEKSWSNKPCQNEAEHLS